MSSESAVTSIRVLVHRRSRNNLVRLVNILAGEFRIKKPNAVSKNLLTDN